MRVPSLVGSAVRTAETAFKKSPISKSIIQARSVSRVLSKAKERMPLKWCETDQLRIYFIKMLSDANRVSRLVKRMQLPNARNQSRS